MTSPEQAARCRSSDLRTFAEALFLAEGFEPEKAKAVAALLVEADLMGHSTHGLVLAPRYLDEIASGAMRTSGEPETLVDRGACVTWNGRGLPGIWLAEACRNNPPRPGVDRVRLPGAAALASRRRAEAEDICLHPSLIEGLEAKAEAHRVALPSMML